VHGDNTYSPDFEAHAQRVLGGLDRVISLLDDQDTLAVELAHLKGQHGEYGITAAQYDVSLRTPHPQLLEWSSGHGHRSPGQRFCSGRVKSRVNVTDPLSDSVLFSF